MSAQKFKEVISKGYTFKKDSLILGTGMLDGEGITHAHVKVPLKTINRHGLIAGATGTGKTNPISSYTFKSTCFQNGYFNFF